VREPVAAALELTEVAASSDPLLERADALLATLRRLVPFDGAWMALADPQQNRYTRLASADLDRSTEEYLCGPTAAREIELTGTNRPAPPLSLSDLPYPAEDLATWAECLIPAGFHEALAVALFAPGGRHVAFLALLSGSKEPPRRDMRRRLGRLTSVLAGAVDPMRDLLPAARLVHGALAAVVLRPDGRTDALPGLPDHPLLSAGSPVLATAHATIDQGHTYSSFLWPVGGSHAPDGHCRITVLASSDDVSDLLTGLVLVSRPGDLRTLTPRELEVLGLLIEGCSNREMARALVVSQRTVAAHLEHILTKLAAPTRTLAAVRAEREGLYVPRPPDGPARRP
jgi:DNA-binding CsgD family transcriptional regulator